MRHITFIYIYIYINLWILKRNNECKWLSQNYAKYISRQICSIRRKSKWLISKSYMNVLWSLSRKITVIIIIYLLFIFKYLKHNFDDSVNRSTFVVHAAMHNQVWPSEWAKVKRKYANVKTIENFSVLTKQVCSICRRWNYAIVNFSYGSCNICKVMSLGCEKQSQHWFWWYF